MYLHSVLDASWMTCSHEMTAWPKIKRLDQDEESNSFRDKGRTSFFRDRPSSGTQGLLAGTMRYLWAKVYFKSWRAYSYRTSSRSGRISSCWLGRKIFFCPISDEVWPGNSVAFLHEVVSSSIDLVAWPVQRGNCRGGFQKKNSTKPRKPQALTWELGTNTLPSIFSANLSKVYLKFL